jgi:hypothetical protein
VRTTTATVDPARRRGRRVDATQSRANMRHARSASRARRNVGAPCPSRRGGGRRCSPGGGPRDAPTSGRRTWPCAARRGRRRAGGRRTARRNTHHPRGRVAGRPRRLCVR